MRNQLISNVLYVMAIFGVLCAATAAPLVVPMKQDPPIMVDGNADDWSDVPSEVKLGKGNFLASFRGESKWGGEKTERSAFSRKSNSIATLVSFSQRVSGE